MDGSMFIGTWWSLVTAIAGNRAGISNQGSVQFAFYRGGSRGTAVYRLSSVECICGIL